MKFKRYIPKNSDIRAFSSAIFVDVYLFGANMNIDCGRVFRLA